MKYGRWALLAAWVVVVLAQAAAPPLDAPARTPTTIVNCVSADRIAYQPGDTGAVLDATDRDDVTQAMHERYPMLERDGLQPLAIVLWHPPEGDWLYAALLAHPEMPNRMCFAAHVVADEIEVTPALLKKYFSIAVPPH